MGTGWLAVKAQGHKWCGGKRLCFPHGRANANGDVGERGEMYSRTGRPAPREVYPIPLGFPAGCRMAEVP